MFILSKIIPGVNDIFTVRPDLKEFWDFNKNTYDTNYLGAQSNRDAWWICSKCGNSYLQKIPSRFRGKSVCLVCNNHKVVAGINDIATTNPELLLIWNYSKNDALGIYPTDLTYGSEKKVW